MPQHDTDNQHNAFNAGQHDCIKGKPCNPIKHGINDAYRMERYYLGYETELHDLQTYLSHV